MHLTCNEDAVGSNPTVSFSFFKEINMNRRRFLGGLLALVVVPIDKALAAVSKSAPVPVSYTHLTLPTN